MAAARKTTAPKPPVVEAPEPVEAPVEEVVAPEPTPDPDAEYVEFVEAPEDSWPEDPITDAEPEVDAPPVKTKGPRRAAGPVVPAPRRTMSQGDHGPKVDEVQKALADKGFDPGPVNGRYGTLTAKAVRRFQSEHGLKVTGDVTPATWEVLVP